MKMHKSRKAQLGTQFNWVSFLAQFTKVNSKSLSLFQTQIPLRRICAILAKTWEKSSWYDRYSRSYEQKLVKNV